MLDSNSNAFLLLPSSYFGSFQDIFFSRFSYKFFSTFSHQTGGIRLRTDNRLGMRANSCEDGNTYRDKAHLDGDITVETHSDHILIVE